MECLTKCELAVLQLVVYGKTNNEIASKLCVTKKTVEKHLSNIFVKLEVRNRTEATHIALSKGLFKNKEPEEE